MSPQTACVILCKITQVAFDCLFPTMGFQMFPKMAGMGGCIVALVAFVWLFSTVYFQMCLQSTCIWGCIITLVAVVWIFPTVRFQVCPQIAFLRECIVTLVAFFWWHRQVIAFKIFLHPSCSRKGKPMQSWTSHFWCLQCTDCLIFGDPIWLDLRYESESFYNLDVWDIWKYCFHSLFLNGSLVSNIEVWYYI